MMFLMMLFIIVFVGLVIYCAKKLALGRESNIQERLSEVDGHMLDLMQIKESLIREKRDLENEASEIFTLYEITKEITKSLKEQEAFEIFKQKLSKHIHFKKCQFLHPLATEIKQFKKSNEHFIFILQGKKQKIGYLAIEGVAGEDREKVMILGHQFALALRRVQLYQELEKIAITDSLTEVHTRRHIIERFKEEMRRSKVRKTKISFLMIDVDHFKSFNDKYGHLAGDQILRGIAGVIKENIREIDIAGRYGGEEFCVILPDTDRQGARYAAERIRRAAEAAFIRAYDTKVQATLSIGIASAPEDGDDVSELIDKADWTLYKAKKQGRNRVCSFGVYNE